MQNRAFALIAVLSMALTAQQDAPLRGPGKFTAAASGTLTGKVSGDASVTNFKNGKRELYFLLNSDEMMSASMMVSASIKLPSMAGNHRLTPAAANALIQWDNLTARTRHSALATGSISFKGTDTISGTFSMSAKAGTETLTLTGEFRNAPAISGVD